MDADEKRRLIGEAFEREIGERYEAHGFRVEYRGIVRGKGDKGIDLVATRGKRQMLVQCKAWSAEELIPAIVIRNLATAARDYIHRRRPHGQVLMPWGNDLEYGVALVTTAKLSQRAKREADELHIMTLEGCSLPEIEKTGYEGVNFAQVMQPLPL